MRVLRVNETKRPSTNAFWLIILNNKVKNNPDMKKNPLFELLVEVGLVS